MRRLALAVLLTASAALAGPFGKVALNDPLYRDLREVAGAGLFRTAMVRFEPDSELTRFECSLLFSSAYATLAEAVDGLPPAGVAQPDPAVRRVAAAMQRLLGKLSAEIESLDIAPGEARVLLAGLPGRLARLPAAERRQVASGPGPLPVYDPSLRGPALDVATGSGGFALTAAREPVPFDGGLHSEGLGASYHVPVFGAAEAGLSWREQRLTGPGEDRPRLSGHILAADLRLRLGDQSVLVEYARSLAERRDGWRRQGQSIRAGYERSFGADWELDVAVAHLTSGHTLLSDLGTGELFPDLYGLEAGVSWRRDRLGVASSAAVYRPEGEPVGFVNRLGGQLFYEPFDGLRVGVSYQTSMRRRLAGLEDAWRDYVEAQVVYQLSENLRAGLSYRRSSDDRRAPDRGPEQVFGASLGIGF